MRNRLINVGLILIAYLLTCAAIWTGVYFQTGLTYSVGDVSLTRVVATRDVENTIRTEENREEALFRADNMNPFFATTLDSSIDQHVYEHLSNFFEGLGELRIAIVMWWEEQIAEQNNAHRIWQDQYMQWEEEFAQWVQRVADEEENPGEEPIPPEFDFVPEEFPLEERFNALSVPLTSSQREFLLALSPEEHVNLYDALILAAEALLEPPGIAEITEETWLNAQEELTKLLDNPDAVTIGRIVLMTFLVPNRVFSETAHQAAWENFAQDYEIVMVREHQLIVDENVIITEEHFAIMEALGLLESDWTRDIVPMVGIFTIIAFAMLICCWFISFYRKRIISNLKEALLLFTLYTVILIILWALDGIDYHFLPILVFTMLIAMLLDSRTALVMNLGFTVIGYFIIDGSIQYLLFFMLAGSLMCLLARYTTERNKIMIASILSAFFNFVLVITISIAFEPHQIENAHLITAGAIAALNGVFTIILAVGSLPLWEAIFGVVTPIKLLYLTNPTNPLMRRLTIEAPGTYHHSLIVANLAESAAFDIGANPHLARAGGYYHDIGKLKYPQYFSENITGINPHDSMDPSSSTKIIISHITYGLKLAAEYRLPQFLRDIIQEHHGNTLIKFFYSKAKDNLPPDAPEDAINKDDYRYPYHILQSRESAVVMLADGVEAAVRSIMAQGNNTKDMKELINKMIKDKLTDGSLADSKLSIRDVDTIASSFYRVLKGMYHERIPYPDDPGSPGGVPVAGGR